MLEIYKADIPCIERTLPGVTGKKFGTPRVPRTTRAPAPPSDPRPRQQTIGAPRPSFGGEQDVGSRTTPSSATHTGASVGLAPTEDIVKSVLAASLANTHSHPTRLAHLPHQ